MRLNFKYTIYTRMLVTTTAKSGEIWAEKGDVITVIDKDADNFTIVRVNDREIFSIWKRKSWVLAHIEIKE